MVGFRLTRKVEKTSFTLPNSASSCSARRYNHKLLTLLALIADHPRMEREGREVGSPKRHFGVSSSTSSN